jgi:hypothetical protein
LGCLVECIASFWLGAPFRRELNDRLLRTGYAITHRTALYLAGNAGKLDGNSGLWITCPRGAERSRLPAHAILLGLTELFIHPRIISVLNSFDLVDLNERLKLWLLRRK